MNVLGYVRCSTGEQALEGVSLQAQRMAIDAECERRDWQLLGVETDVASASSTRRRPGLATAIARLDQSAAAALVVSRLDRLSRSTRDFYDLMDYARRHGWAIVMLDPAVDMTDPMGEAMAGVAAVFAQLERRLIAQRTREGIAAKKAAGTYRGGVLLPQAEPVAAEVVERIMRQVGKASSREIAALLDAAGVPTPRGGECWSPRTVRRVIEREQARASA